MEAELDTTAAEPQTDDKPAALPLGTYAPFDVSDQKEWTKTALDEVGEGKLQLAENLRAMVVAAAQRESLGRRLEVGQAWRLQLMDRGFHRLVPQPGGGWRISGSSMKKNMDIYGHQAENSLYDLNVIGVHNDIIVNALKREDCKVEFDPKTDDDKAITAAAKANKLKIVIAQDAAYRKRQGEVARLLCTDERSCIYMRPVVDAQRLGFEDDTPNVVPETEDATPAGVPSKRPRIQTEMRVFGKLEHKCQISNDQDEQSPYQILAWEEDVASERACFPWVAEDIKGGSAGIAEIELDRVARESIKLAIQGGQVTGQAGVKDATRLMCWLTPKMYWDDSCQKESRKWFLQNFPKGCLAVYSGTTLAFARNESWNEVLTIIHARTGKGQNRRALTEAYAGPNMILNNLFDLLYKFFTSTVPRVFLDSKAFNIEAVRQSGNTVGRIDPFNSASLPQGAVPMLQMPMPTHQPSLPTTINWLAGDFAQLMTGAQLTLQGAQNAQGEQGTLGEAQMDNDSAMTRLSEPWTAMTAGFANATLQAVKWNARVQPAGKVFDRVTSDMGRVRVEMQELSADLLVVADTDSQIPESFTDREERIWQLVSQMPQNQFIATMMTNPANARLIKDAARMGLTIPGANSWEKQEGEFAVLLDSQPLPNPALRPLQVQIAELKVTMEHGAADVKQRQQMGEPVDPAEVQALQQGLQAMQQLTQQMQQIPPLVSSVPVRADGSEEDVIEMACCLQKMISPEGRRLASSKNRNEQAAFANLHLHWNEHQEAAKKMAAQNQQPVEPKVSITAALDKLSPEVQAKMLAKMDVAADPKEIGAMGPHEITHEVEGVNAQGAKEKIVTSLSGKTLQ